MTNKVAVLRPEPGASSTVALIKEQGLDPVSLPFFAIKTHHWTAPDPKEFDGILITSANAIGYGGDELEKLKSLPVYAVGPASARIAKAKGFKVAAVGQRGVSQLLKRIPHTLRLIHLVAEDRLDYRLVWQKTEPVTVYESVKIEDVDASVLDGMVVLVHSPRAARRLAELAKDKSTISVVTISEQTTKTLGEGWKTVVTAERPDDRLMVELAKELCDKPAKE